MGTWHGVWVSQGGKVESLARAHTLGIRAAQPTGWGEDQHRTAVVQAMRDLDRVEDASGEIVSGRAARLPRLPWVHTAVQHMHEHTHLVERVRRSTREVALVETVEHETVRTGGGWHGGELYGQPWWVRWRRRGRRWRAGRRSRWWWRRRTRENRAQRNWWRAWRRWRRQ